MIVSMFLALSFLMVPQFVADPDISAVADPENGDLIVKVVFDVRGPTLVAPDTVWTEISRWNPDTGTWVSVWFFEDTRDYSWWHPPMSVAYGWYAYSGLTPGSYRVESQGSSAACGDSQVSTTYLTYDG